MQISHMFLAMLEDVGDEILKTEAAPVTGVLAPDFSAVGGFRDLMLVAKLTGTAVEELFSDVVALGVVEVAELSSSDLAQLESCKKLRPLEARRLNAASSAPRV